MSLEMQLLSSYLITLLLEGALALVWGLRRRRDWLVLLLVNTATNPPVVLCAFGLRLLLSSGVARWPLLVLELLVLLLEGFFYQKTGTAGKRPWLFSVCANAASFLGGLAVSAVIF